MICGFYIFFIKCILLYLLRLSNVRHLCVIRGTRCLYVLVSRKKSTHVFLKFWVGVPVCALESHRIVCPFFTKRHLVIVCFSGGALQRNLYVFLFKRALLYIIIINFKSFFFVVVVFLRKRKCCSSPWSNQSLFLDCTFCLSMDWTFRISPKMHKSISKTLHRWKYFIKFKQRRYE